MMNALVPLLVIVPLVGAAITLILGRYPRLQIAISVSALTLVTVCAAVLLAVVDQTSEPIVVKVAAGNRRSASCWWSTGCRRSWWWSRR